MQLSGVISVFVPIEHVRKLAVTSHRQLHNAWRKERRGWAWGSQNDSTDDDVWFNLRALYWSYDGSRRKASRLWCRFSSAGQKGVKSALTDAVGVMRCIDCKQKKSEGENETLRGEERDEREEMGKKCRSAKKDINNRSNETRMSVRAVCSSDCRPFCNTIIEYLRSLIII